MNYIDFIRGKEVVAKNGGVLEHLENGEWIK